MSQERDEFRFRGGRPFIYKDPDELLDYPVDWTDWLGDSGSDTISVSAWQVPAGITQNSALVSGAKAIVFLSGGTVGSTYHVVNRITTAGGRISERGFDVIIQAS